MVMDDMFFEKRICFLEAYRLEGRLEPVEEEREERELESMEVEENMDDEGDVDDDVVEWELVDGEIWVVRRMEGGRALKGVYTIFVGE